MRQWIGFLALCLSMGLTGCFQEDRPASVIDAWYQKKSASNYYIVQENDTIYSIAFAFGLDYRALVEANHLEKPHTVRPGQKIVMTYQPEKGGSTPISYSTSKARVASGNPVLSPADAPPLTEAWLWPAKGRLIGRYSSNALGLHGISISGEFGEPIRASASGTVVYSGDGVRGYGNLIIIKHNRTYLSAYAFNERNLVVTGDEVRAGQVIAKMGQNDAGRTLLYFEIRQNGVPVDPLQYLH